jgi:hypothetical protein
LDESAEVRGTLAALRLHPVKSCAGLEVREALLIETGLEWDRQWMVVDDHGEMLTQREVPRLALVQTALRGDALLLRAPGMLSLHLALGTVEDEVRVRVWDDEVRAYDMGRVAAQWIADFLGTAARLVRFDPEQRRLSERRWSGGIEAENAFSDGFPLLVASTASLADLNTRLASRGAAPVAMDRFRPNLVLDGLAPFDEDHLGEITIAADGGPVVLRLVKPCVRCSIPNVDPATGTAGTEPGDTLAGFRADARMNGGITFGMNAVVVDGIDRTLRAGQPFVASWAF